MEAKNLGDFLIIYEKFATSENKSKRTIETVTAAVSAFNKFLGSCDDITRIQAEDLRRYIGSLQERSKWSGHPTIKGRKDNLSLHTIACYVRSIRSFWSWLKREGFIDHNLFEQVKPPRAPRKIVETLTPEQITHLLKNIPRGNPSGYRDFAIIITLYGTGLRISELVNLKIEDINFENGQIKALGKGGKERFLYGSAKVYKATFKYLNQWRPKATSDNFFLNENGHPLTRFHFEHRMQVHCKKAG
ncbi:tyrosine-type recombinase/integrase, partial [Chloroflexota bacterium]